jgi:hypothetical protein
MIWDIYKKLLVVVKKREKNKESAPQLIYYAEKDVPGLGLLTN